MRPIRLVAATAAAIALTITPALAGQHGRPTTAPTHPAAPTHSMAPAHPSASTHATSTTHTTHATGATATSTTPHTTATTVPQRIAAKPQLASRLQALLPAGTTVQTAAAGFRNQGQFIAAVHVSHNLGIPFDQLKAEMVSNHLSLGQSIQKLRPAASTTSEVEHEVEHAEAQEQEDLKVTTTTTTATGTAVTTPAKKHGSR